MPSAAICAACDCPEDETRPAVCLDCKACKQEWQPNFCREADREYDDRGQRSYVREFEIRLNTIETCPKPCLAC